MIENTRPLADINDVTSNTNHTSSALHKSKAKVDRRVEEISKLFVKWMERARPSWHRAQRHRSQSLTPSRSTGYHENSGGQQGPAERQSSSCRTLAAPNWLCFYHSPFRDKARKCIQPRNWTRKAVFTFASLSTNACYNYKI
ncbi:hypothetical protein EVAR_92920_1 [Eumeta japonica]|uniref:Uncharacterized protein n=1 Tax=Eumeta variegata TaxID=151549 RepID=A0A4C1TDN5_EUMVA|nr:hypothetical protein EVAR_92920_1 [Eumeta japonica]